jgi:hypothetical protein
VQDDLKITGGCDGAPEFNYSPEFINSSAIRRLGTFN